MSSILNSKTLSMEFYLQTMAGSSPGEGTPVRVLHSHIVGTSDRPLSRVAHETRLGAS